MVQLNVDRARRLKDQGGGRGGGFWRPDSGRNVIRIFPFEHVVTKRDFEEGRYAEGEAEVGETSGEIVYEGAVHFPPNGSPVNCKQDDCPICEQRDKLIAEVGSDDDRVNRLRAQPRYYMQIVDMNDKDEGIQIFGAPPSVWWEISGALFDPDVKDPVELLGCKGRDFIIKYNPNTTPNKMYQVKVRDSSKCKELPEAIEDGVRDLFEVDPLQPGWSGSGDSGDEEETEEETEEQTESSGGKRRKKRRKKASDDADEEDDLLQQAEDDLSVLKGKEITFYDDEDDEEVRGPVIDVEDDNLVVDGEEFEFLVGLDSVMEVH